MSVIATVTIPATEFPLGSLLDGDADRDVTVTVETTVPTSEGIIPYLWVPLEVVESVLEGLEARSSVAAAAVVDELDDSALVKIEWNDRINGVLESIRENEAIVTNAVGTASQWTFRLRFPSYEDLSAFYTTCADRDISIELVQLHEAVSPDSQFRFGLTSAQRDLIVSAYEAGYFDVPRKTTLVELGERLGISDSAVSQRLRRGLATLINSTLVVEPQPSGSAPRSVSRRLGAGTGTGPAAERDPEPEREPEDRSGA